MLTINQSPPEQRLRELIHVYVQRESHLVDAELVEPVVARLGSILEFQFADPYEVPLYGIEKPNPSPLIAVIGPITERRARIVFRGHVQALSVVFQPLGLHALFGVPISPLADFGFEGHGVLGRTVSELYERLGNAKNFMERTEILNGFFLKRLDQLRTNETVSAALKLLLSPYQGRTVYGIADRVGVSSRQLERLCAQFIGMPPQRMMRIARFQRAIRMKVAGAPSWTEIAHAAKYHDQMHMVREMRALAGDSPARAFERMEPQYLSRIGL